MTTTIERPVTHGMLSALLAAGVLLSGGCFAAESDLTPQDRAGELDGVGVVEGALVGGTATSARPEIGWLSIGAGSSFCTATLVGARYVLTAAHCISFPIESNIRFNLTDATGVQRNYNVIAGRKFNFNDDESPLLPDGHRDDVAILQLSQAVPSSVAIPAAIAAAIPASGTQTIFGYGCQNRTTETGGGFKQFISFTMGNNSQALCPGDSGGPVVIGSVNGNGQIWGTNRGYFNSNGNDIFGSAPWYKEDILQQILQWSSAIFVEPGVDRAGMDYRLVNNVTSAQCLIECQNDLRCQTFSYTSSNSRCHLKAAVPDWSFRSGVTSMSQLGIELNVDRFGNDFFIFDVPAGRIDTCAGACARDAACKSYTLAPAAVAGNPSRCHLKNAAPAGVARAGVISGAKRGAEVDVDRPGNDKVTLTLNPGTTVNDCQLQCAISADCRAFSWEQATRTCRLKSSAGSPVFRAGTTSGVKRGTELNRDRPGGDFHHFNQPSSNTPQACQAACMQDLRCQAWTFIPLGLLGNGLARCSLKNSVPAQTTVQGLISGVRGTEFF